MKRLMGLMVALGAIIDIPAGTSLTVIGGDGEGQVGAGAGIEVPPFSKLIVSGEGTLTAIGGNAAPGVFTVDGSAGRFFRVIVSDP